jgi:hypothetical protein
MNLYDYLSAQVPNDCYMVMQRRVGNVPKPRNARQMGMMLRKYVQTFGNDALMDLASIHPDKELLSGANPVSDFGLNEVGEVSAPKEDKNYLESGCKCGGKCGGNCGGNCGCGGKCGGNKEENFSNFIASPNTPQSYSDLNPQSKTHEIIISMGVVILGLALLVKVMK